MMIDIMPGVMKTRNHQSSGEKENKPGVRGVDVIGDKVNVRMAVSTLICH